MPKILVVDDDPTIRKLAKVNLEQRGYTVMGASSGTEAVSILQQDTPDLVILDLIMPGMGGVDVCTWIRTRSDLPIIVVSARDDEELIVRALEAGADDYVIKPFRIKELFARIRAVMRRSTVEPATESATDSKTNENRIEIGDLLIDLKARRAFVSGVDLEFTRTEFALLAELAKNRDEILSHEELLSRVWGVEYRDTSYYLYVYFGRIRNKMGTEYGKLLKTVPGMGYILSTTFS
jgi:two-component system KDP operon response regulator KdpE